VENGAERVDEHIPEFHIQRVHLEE